MAFIQPCRINLNNENIINKLIELSYDNGWYHLLKCNSIGTIIDDNGKGRFYGICDTRDYYPNQYDCDTNVDLFFALAALKDNTDLNQWMICLFDHTDVDNGIEYKKGQWRIADRKKMKKVNRQDAWVKATIDDIINHFK